MKHCPKCRENKDLSEFSQNSRSKDGYQAWCKLCSKARHSAYYQETKSEYEQKARKREREMAAWFSSLKEKPCSICAGEYPSFVMHFHHREKSSKSHNVANMIRKFSKGNILDEIAKCDLVCANCHAIITHGPIV